MFNSARLLAIAERQGVKSLRAIGRAVRSIASINSPEMSLELSEGSTDEADYLNEKECIEVEMLEALEEESSVGCISSSSLCRFNMSQLTGFLNKL